MSEVAKEAIKLPRVFVVNPDPKHRGDVERALGRHYDISGFSDNGEALNAIRDTHPDIVVFDERAKPRSGDSLLDIKRRSPDMKDIPFIITGSSKQSAPYASQLDHGIDDFLSAPYKRSALLGKISRLISGTAERNWEKLPEITAKPLKVTVEEYQGIARAIEKGEPIDYSSAEASCAPVVEAIRANAHHDLLKAVQSHHDYTYVHSLRVSTLLTLFGHGIGVKGDDLMVLSTGGLLHDVGKMVTPESVLNKPGKLDDEEWVVMKGHVDHTKDLLAVSPEVTHGARIIAEQHHEKIDGSGYPLGLKGRELNDLARMSAIVDIFGALTDKRSYKPAYPSEKAFAILESMTEQIDQNMLKLFKSIFGDG